MILRGTAAAALALAVTALAFVSVRGAGETAPAAGRAVAAVTIDYPPEGAVFPPGFAPPRFLWHDPVAAVDRWRVAVALDGAAAIVETFVTGEPAPKGELDARCISPTNRLHEPAPYEAAARSWRPTREQWEAIQKHVPGRPVRVTIEGFARDEPAEVLSRGSVAIETSTDPLGAVVFYRDVPLMPAAGEDGVIKPLDQRALPLIAWRLKDLTRDDSRVLLTGMSTCANCHSFSADGRTLGMDLDGPDGDKGAYAVADIRESVVIDNEQVMTWNAFPGRPKDRYTFGFLARMSPDGRRVVATVNEALYVRNYTDYKILQTFYPTRGILAVWSRETGKIEALPGADDPRYVHCNPVWSPDGKWIVFCRAPARDPYERGQPPATFADDPHETPLKFDLYRIPFNEGRGGTAEPVAGASANGMSNSFPKITPDGRWIVWVQSRNGMLLRPDGKLWIVPAAGGTPRLMRCNTPLMNSWHSFTPNGRWMVFSSKQNRPYTQMFLTHIDEEGRDTPALLIENATADNRAVNLPEFVAVDYDGFREIKVPAADYHHYLSKGVALARAGKPAEAVAEYEKALAGDNKDWRLNDWRIHDNTAKSLMKLGRKEEALEHAQASVAIYAKNAETQGNLGYLLFEAGRLAEARPHFDAAVKLAPEDAKAWHGRAALRLSLGDAAGAESDYGEAVRLKPEWVGAWEGRGLARLARGDAQGGLSDLDRAIALDPKEPTAWFFRARVRASRGEIDGALADLDRAAALAPPRSRERAEIEALRDKLRAGR
jgi:tetratricopeptide (TPR) repeat protein/Tol biopolymer transport system component